MLSMNCSSISRHVSRIPHYVKHAASVHPEPGSNSHKKFFPFQDQLANFNHSSILNVLLFFRLLWLSSLLFSRTHFNANCFAVLNESFKVISLFSYQSSLFCCCSATFISYQISKCLSTTFLTFFKVICFCCIAHATAYIYYHKHLRLSTTFFFHFQFYFLTLFLEQKNNGERGIWTLAPRERPTPLAGAPLQPLEYFSIFFYKIDAP